MSEGAGAGTGNSNAGSAGVLRADDQRNVKNSDIQNANRYHEGNINAHVSTDSSMSTPRPPQPISKPSQTCC